MFNLEPSIFFGSHGCLTCGKNIFAANVNKVRLAWPASVLDTVACNCSFAMLELQAFACVFKPSRAILLANVGLLIFALGEPWRGVVKSSQNIFGTTCFSVLCQERNTIFCDETLKRMKQLGSAWGISLQMLCATC